MTNLISVLKTVLYHPIGMYHTYKRSAEINASLSDKPKIFLLNVPTHGNLGDHLISVAAQKFFADNCANYQIVPITSSDLYFSISISLRSATPDDILCITGGGFLGSMYEEERRLYKIAKRYKNNKIIILPQTIFYENNKTGTSILEKAKRIYANHPNIYVMAREKATYDLLQQVLIRGRDSNIALTPDIALYLHNEPNTERNTILWCLRNDGEVNAENTKLIEKARYKVQRLNITQVETDTYIHKFIPVKNECQEVEKKIQEFGKAKLVITDRLHGMIYAVITNTPVIALNNNNGKVEQVYNAWLSDIPFVKFVSHESEVDDAINSLLEMNNAAYDNSKIISHFKPIIDAINA
ncbi:MAG: polysaccharide pyruvyl transferase family protein [Bacteroidales bacterium]|nr:polysaccharide pyruvyl transferase family protein [Bacteroidales bacterium]